MLPVYTKAGSVFGATDLELMIATEKATGDKMEGPYVLLRGERVALLGEVHEPRKGTFMIPWESIDHGEVSDNELPMIIPGFSLVPKTPAAPKVDLKSWDAARRALHLHNEPQTEIPNDPHD